MRDIESLLLNTLATQICIDTGIPTGSVFIKMPSEEFISISDGSMMSATNNTRIPAVGISYMRDSKANYNNYGESIFTPAVSGIITSYTPLGSICLYLGINLYTNSRAEERYYGALLQNSLFKNKFLFYLNDVINGEYFSIKFTGTKDTREQMPYRKIFMIETESRVLLETTGYSVYDIITSLGTVQNVGVNFNDLPAFDVSANSRIFYKN